jgi:hypothetical protein
MPPNYEHAPHSMTRCRIAGLTAPSGSGYSVICHAGPIQIGPDVVGDVMWSRAYRIIRGRNRLGFDCHISPHIFALEGYNLPQICAACGYNVNPDKTFDVMSSCLSWLCCSWFDDESGFLKMLYDSGALISGSAALKLVLGKDLFPPTLT